MTSSLTDKQYNELIQARLKSPESFKKALVNRKRRKLIGKDGRLLIVAADHTARGIISAGNEKYIIANRRLLLDRLLRSLSNPNVDGVLASADIVEELAWLGALESKLVFGTMNRGGYLGTTWGLDDPMTAYDADSIAELGLDAGKVLIRFEDTDIGVGRTIEYVVEAMRLLTERKIVCLVEPLPYKKDANGMPRLIGKLHLAQTSVMDESRHSERVNNSSDTSARWRPGRKSRRNIRRVAWRAANTKCDRLGCWSTTFVSIR
jgi:hypothetical protein